MRNRKLVEKIVEWGRLNEQANDAVNVVENYLSVLYKELEKTEKDNFSNERTKQDLEESTENGDSPKPLKAISYVDELISEGQEKAEDLTQDIDLLEAKLKKLKAKPSL